MPTSSRGLELVLERGSDLAHDDRGDGERSRSSEVLAAPHERCALGVGRREHLVVVRLAISRSAANITNTTRLGIDDD